MLEKYEIAQPIAYKILINSIKNDKLSHAYLFELNNYHEGFDMVLAFAKYLLCKDHFVNYENCGSCNQCLIVDNREYSELKIIDSDGMWIKKEQLDNLQKDFCKKSFNGGFQIYIINNAEKLNTQAANSILKFLEEPEPNIIAILVTNNKYSILDTIISRCQIISLKECNRHENSSLIESIANYLFNNKDDINNFLQNKKNEEIINKVLEFINYLEKNKKDTILYSNKLWHSVIKEKEDIINSFSIMLLYYKDILNYKVKKSTELFKYDFMMDYISSQNTEKELCIKIQLVLKYKSRIKYNVNTALLIDKFIIEMGKLND